MSSAHCRRFSAFPKACTLAKGMLRTWNFILHLVWSFRITYFLSSFYSKSPYKIAFDNYYKCQYFFLLA